MMNKDASKAEKLNRILELKAALGCKTDKEFNNMINFTQQSYSGIMKGTRTFGTDLLWKIVVNVKGVNPRWLEYGEMPMFLEVMDGESDLAQVIADLRYTVSLQKDYIAELQNRAKGGNARPEDNATCAVAG